MNTADKKLETMMSIFELNGWEWTPERGWLKYEDAAQEITVGDLVTHIDLDGLYIVTRVRNNLIETVAVLCADGMIVPKDRLVHPMHADWLRVVDPDSVL